jgi:hypothetical protein
MENVFIVLAIFGFIIAGVIMDMVFFQDLIVELKKKSKKNKL